MRKPSNPSYHSLGALNRAIRKEINLSFPDHLSLAGDVPEEWPKSSTPEHQRLIRQIKSGLAFYCISDFLWPSGCENDPIDIWVGHTLRKTSRYPQNPYAYLFKLGDGTLPDLGKVLWTPRRPDVQPVALRTYADAMVYQRAGALLERRFLPLITSQWRIREHLWEQAKVTPEFHNRFRFKELHYFGDYPSRLVESILAEIRHVLGANVLEMHLPPSAAMRKAFQRQMALLKKAWAETSEERNKPDLEWVRQRLLRPVYHGQIIENGYADRYRKSLVTALIEEKTLC